MDELYPFLGINSKNILKKSCLQECAKKWVAITAGTLLCCIYFSIKHIQQKHANQNTYVYQSKYNCILISFIFYFFGHLN